jgi:UV excision repair protein RAD23
MKLSFKTLKGEQFTLEVAPDDTVLRVKGLVAARQNNADAAAGYRLIYAGKVLKDHDSLDAAGVKETGFLVVMPPAKTSKPPAAAAAAAAAAARAHTDPAARTPHPVDGAGGGGGPQLPAAVAVPAVAANAVGGGGGEMGLTADQARRATTPAAAALNAPDAVPNASGPLPSTAGTPAPLVADGDASLLTGEAYEASVRSICDMGFPEDQVRRAMRAAFNNPGRAVEYLFSGIPDLPDHNLGQPQPPPAAGAGAGRTPPHAAASPQQHAAATAAALRAAQPQQDPGVAPGTPFDMFGGHTTPVRPGAGGAAPRRAPGNDPATPGMPTDPADAQAGHPASGGVGSLDFLRQLPQFNNMRRVIQANPGLLQELLQQVNEVNPALMGIITANQTEFVRLINEQPPPGEEGGDETMEQLAAAMANAGGGGHGMATPGQIYVTEDENQQLFRLTELGQSMGVERMHVVEAWLACERDENMAANYLFDHIDEIRAAQEEDEAAAAQDNGNQGDDDHPGLNGPPS